jgi:chromosome segregation ATPase
VREAEIAREKQASERANARVEALRAQVAVSANRIAELEELLAQAPQKAEIEQASIDGINADLRDQTIAQRRELESLRGSLASATEALADRDATIQALDDKLALTQEKFVALKTGQHSDCVPEDLFRNVERENRELDRRISLLKKHLDLAWEVFEG